MSVWEFAGSPAPTCCPTTPPCGRFTRRSNRPTGPCWHIWPSAPAKEVILAARDRVLARDPKLRVVGCHLGSDEDDLTRLAKRLDAYPNFAVDAAARSLAATHERDWAFFAGDGAMEYAGRPTRGLALPDGVLRKLFRENAL